MFFFLSKTLYFFLMPLGIVIIVFFIGRSSRNPWRKKRYYRIAIYLLIIFTNPFLANEAIKGWEMEPLPLNELNKTYDVAVVLTGVADNQREPQDRVYFNKGADRVFHTFQLYKLNKIEKILISGGSGSFGEVKVKEADNLKSAFLLMGVSEEDLLVENESSNTRQSAVNCTEIIGNNAFKSVLLITSSFHMKRASLCFKKVNIEHDVFPADFYGSVRRYTPDRWLPNPGALKKWTIVFHEVLGITAYWVMGYI